MRAAWLTAEAVEPYQELTAGLLAGHLYLPRAPDRRLAKLKDPYDPVQNAPYRVANLSYYQGHYYLYLGIAPALTLFAPVHLLTGLYLTQRAAVVIFCTLGSTAGLWLLWFVRRHWLQRCPLPVLLASGSALLFADGYQVVLGPGSAANGVAIAGGYGFAMAALAALAWGAAKRRAWPWLMLGGFSLGLAVASRPNYLFGALGLAFFLRLSTEFSTPRTAGNRPGARLAATYGPFAAVIAALLTYNLDRFGDPLEFGQRYMLGAWNQTRLAALGSGSALVNLRCYLWRPDHLAAAFPFIKSPDEFATSVLFNAPWVWLTPLAVWALFTGSKPSAVRALASAALTLAATNLLTLIFLPSGDSTGSLISANARYIFDFQPALVLFVCLGALMAGDRLAVRRFTSRIFSLGLFFFALLSMLVAISLQFQPLPPETYRPLAAIMNRPALLYERWCGQVGGPVAFEATFPRGYDGESDPLVDTGRPGASDLLYVHYLGAGQARFGLARDGAGGPVGAPVAVDFTKRHRLEIWMGSLLPPVGDPNIAQLSDAAASILKRRVRVVLDGRTVLDDVANCHPASLSEVWFGSCPVTPGLTAGRFRGTLGPPIRLPIAVPANGIPPPAYGDLELRVRLPPNAPLAAEPLVTTGITGAADLVYLKVSAAGQIQIGYDHWGHPGLISPVLTVDRSISHRIVIHLASLDPPIRPQAGKRTDRSDSKTGGRILLDGREVLASAETAYPSSPYDVAIARNPIGASTCGYAFSGEVLSVRRLPESSDATSAHD